ncbi:MAG: hypothetical protein MUP85_06865 [Candidatus Lokiarchaeota archaeon]|nr:hypothetical protein [Candidatus Lokiarchaeota archaeon]
MRGFLKKSRFINRILPEKAENEYKGYKIAKITFLIICIISIIRSLIHFLAPDGGAESIAGIDLSIEGGEIIVAFFALWGSSQLLLALVFLIVYFRYDNLIPLMYTLIIIEYVMRIVVGRIRPFETMNVPPGAIWNVIIIPLAIVMLLLSIKQPNKQKLDINSELQ